MQRYSSWIRWIHLALCGSVFLAGCPYTGNGTGSVAGITSASVLGTSSVCSVPANSDTLVNEVLSRINTERTSRGLNSLTLNQTLCEIAKDYCCEMIEGGFFSHFNPDTREGIFARAVKANYLFLAVGENLAAGQHSASQAMNEWMDSPDHRDNILGIQWQEVGIGVRTGGEYGVYWVQVFGYPP